jgi:predicted PurR-regulated permease PerM
VTIIVIGGSIYGLILLVVSFSEDLPQIKEQVTAKMKVFQQLIENMFGISKDQIESVSQNVQESGESVSQLFTATANTILIIGFIPVYTFLMLSYRDKFRAFVSMTYASNHKNVIDKILDQTAEVVPKHMKGLFYVCLILIVVNAAGFYLIRIEYALIFGVIAAILNLIPYLGTVIGYEIVFLFVLFTQFAIIALYVIL